MTCEVKIIEDSVSECGKRLTTVQLKYWRAVHSELMTHRVFSRNASSSRAIPVAKVIEQVRTNPAGPIHWGANQPGMQADAELGVWDKEAAQASWLYAAGNAANSAEKMMNLGLHKQVANRILEPFQYIQVVVTASEWDNFFALRCHPDAQPEIKELAMAIRDAMAKSIPWILKEGEWHLPYVSDEERSAFGPIQTHLRGGPGGFQAWTTQMEAELCCKLSAARCARVSYMLHDGTVPNIAKDLELYERLVGSAPIHASPIEHQATPDEWIRWADQWDRPELHGNFVGWKQYRKMVERDFRLDSKSL